MMMLRNAAKYCLLAYMLMFFTNYAFAEPNISSISGSLTHKGIITISGSDFGTKNPAAPLMWDDCEGHATDSDAAVSSVWDEVWPIVGGAPVQAYRTRYRRTPFDTPDRISSPVNSVRHPHANGFQVLAGGHYTYPNNNPPYVGGSTSYRAVGVTVDSGSADKNIWFAIWYYRVDPEWQTPCECGGVMVNHKTDVTQTSNLMYGEDNSYTVYRTGACRSGDVEFNIGHGGGCAPSYPTGYSSVNNPRLGWVHYETRRQSDANTGFRAVYIDNELAVESSTNCPNWQNNTRSFSIGGYYRWSIDCSSNTSSFRGYSSGTDSSPVNNSWRYFDDIYIDNTWSRVMLANNATYSSATIIEPQIPSAWNNTSISCTVNIGKFSDGETAYVFVFDAENNHNATGYPVVINGGGGDNPPAVHISIPTSENTYATLGNTIDIAGSASDDNGISSIVWNNNRGGSGSANNDSGNWASFSVEDISLRDGDNIITITATDSAGQISIDTITVTYSTDNIIQVFNANEQTGDATWADSSVTYCVRLLIEGNYIDRSGDRIILGFQGRSSGSYTIKKVSIAKRDVGSSEGNVIDSSWTKVFFDGNSEATWETAQVTVPAGTEKLSDAVDLSLEFGSDYYVTFMIESPAVWLGPPSSYRELYFQTEDHTEDIDWSGNGYSTTQDYHALSSIYLVGNEYGPPRAPLNPTITY